jgi:putative sigma-54 modulation protein
MRLDVTFRNLDTSDKLREYCDRRLQKVGRFLKDEAEAHVVLRVEKHRELAEVTITGVRGRTHVASAEASDLRTAIDAVSHKLEQAVRRAHDRRVRGQRAQPTAVAAEHLAS